MLDLFGNNTSNDYIYPDLPQCAGSADSYTFEFIPGQNVGVISGSTILTALSLNDVVQSISGWVQQTKILQPGEVSFIQGGTKGIVKSFQYFNISDASFYHSRDYMGVDISINYYNNFKYYDISLNAISDFSNGIDIETALNIAFSDKNIKVQATYTDSSALTFTGTLDGYYFNITGINSSTFLPDTSIFTETLVEDISAFIPAQKYPNSGMLGYVLKVSYQDLSDDQKLIELNHVPTILTYYTTNDNVNYTKVVKTVDVGKNGASDATAMSAGDYLDYIQTNNKWEKVGQLKIWLSAPDTLYTENLIPGFFVYNPGASSVKIDYLIIN